MRGSAALAARGRRWEDPELSLPWAPSRSKRIGFEGKVGSNASQQMLVARSFLF